jgi:hypothetical protein
MPVTPRFTDAGFDPETVVLLASAFETAWSVVQKSGSPLAAPEHADATRERLAKRIIELGQRGERNAQRIVDDALTHISLQGR